MIWPIINKKIERGQFDPFGDNDDNDNDNDDNDNDDEKSFLKALQLRWGALKNIIPISILHEKIYKSLVSGVSENVDDFLICQKPYSFFIGKKLSS